jgi:hypothetical protein
MSDNVFVMKDLTRDRHNNIRISGDLILKGQPTSRLLSVNVASRSSSRSVRILASTPRVRSHNSSNLAW